jgi:molybdopterin molybdotransferase
MVTGGSSIGKKDLVPEVIKSTGHVIAHGISMKPGKPTGLALIKNKPVIMMPGYSVACIIAFIIFVKPLIQKYLQINPPKLGLKIKAKLVKRVASTAGRTDFIRVMVFMRDNEFYVLPKRASGSGILSSMVESNGLLEIPENIEGFEEGDTVSVIMLRDQIPEEVKDD